MKSVVHFIIVGITDACVIYGSGFFLDGAEGRKNGNTIKSTGVGAVVSNCEGCADVGANILVQGGSAVDAAIATLLCEGVLLPSNLGLGGGFIAMIYNKKRHSITTLNARESAPAAAKKEMFLNKPITGAISAAIPSELLGYWELHKRYGKLPWKNLFESSIQLCESGYKVSKYLANNLIKNAERIRSEPTMAEIFTNPSTNEIYRDGDTMHRPKLGATLRILAEEGAETMYGGGRIGKWLTEDIQKMGGIITETDLQNYKVRWEKPIVTELKNYTLCTTPLPSSGVVLAFILTVMQSMHTDRSDIYWQRLIETFKHAYGCRSELGDFHHEPHALDTFHKMLNPKFIRDIIKRIKDDCTVGNGFYYGARYRDVHSHGTANVGVVESNGDSVLITSTINNHFGSKTCSRRTGIILNDQMDDFSTPNIINSYGIPPSPFNFIKPGKRPMSSVCPSMIFDSKGEMQLMVGGAGGSKITTSVAQVILRYIVLNQSVREAINSARIHHQLFPMHVEVEPNVPKDVIDHLQRAGHDLDFVAKDKAFSALTAIGMKTGIPVPICDRRRAGSCAIVHHDQRNIT